MYSSNDILFPHHAIQTLKHLRGESWRALVERVASLPENHEETIAFMLMMVRINGCMACETDSYRAMRGCVTCAQQIVRRYKGTDEDLLDQFQRALAEVRKFARSNTHFDLLSG